VSSFESLETDQLWRGGGIGGHQDRESCTIEMINYEAESGVPVRLF
jgi:hypothetical protein